MDLLSKQCKGLGRGGAACSAVLDASNSKLTETTTTTATFSRYNSSTRLVCCCFDFFSQQREGREKKKRATGGGIIEKNIHGLGSVCVCVLGWFGTPPPRMCLSGSGRRLTSVDRRAGEGAGWLFLWRWAPMTRWQQALRVTRALSCHRNLPLDTACWLAVSNCCCSVRLMKPLGWGRACSAACSHFPALLESVAGHITGQLLSKHSHRNKPHPCPSTPKILNLAV